MAGPQSAPDRGSLSEERGDVSTASAHAGERCLLLHFYAAKMAVLRAWRHGANDAAPFAAVRMERSAALRALAEHWRQRRRRARQEKRNRDAQSREATRPLGRRRRPPFPRNSR